MGRLQSDAKLLAIGLLNIADDDGYFLADPVLLRNAIFPFSDRSVIDHGLITDLSRADWIEVREHHQMGKIGLVKKFTQHQVINRPKKSKIKQYWDVAKITDESLIDHGSITDRSHHEQGTGNREWNSDQGSGKLAKNENLFPESEPQPKPKKPKTIPDTPHAKTIEACVLAFQELTGSKYMFSAAKDGAAVKEMLAHFPPEEILKRWRIGIQAQGYLHTANLASLRAKFNELAEPDKAAPKPRMSSPMETPNYTGMIEGKDYCEDYR